MRNCLKVLVLAQYFPPDMGGASARVSNVVRGLPSRGCDITVVAAFPHYPHGKVPRKYKGKPIVWVANRAEHYVATNVALASIAFILIGFFALSSHNSIRYREIGEKINEAIIT